MNWNRRIRQTHRWVSLVFTLTVIINIVIAARGDEPAAWVYMLPLIPLALLLLTGLYMFVLPYAAKRRGGGRPASGHPG